MLDVGSYVAHTITENEFSDSGKNHTHGTEKIIVPRQAYKRIRRDRMLEATED
jgi:hypothetical protein